LSRNEIKDGCHGSHIGKAAKLVFERNLPMIDQIHPVDFKAISQGVQKLLCRNKIQDGCYGGHIEKVASLVFEMGSIHPVNFKAIGQSI